MALPRFILLKSNNNNKYLRYIKEEDSNHAFLQFSQDENAENVEIQYLKFEVQKSENFEGFVHVRSCYNNKYWVRKSADTNWIVAEANEPEEDQSKWCCTLFKPILLESVDDDVEEPEPKPIKIRLVHISKHYACVTSMAASGRADLLVIGKDEEEDSGPGRMKGDDDAFLAYNAVASYFVLPEYVAFMGHNDQYAALTTIDGVTYLEFRTPDIGHAGVSHSLVQYLPNNPPFVLVQNRAFIGSGQTWMYKAPYIVVNDTSDLNDRARLTPIRLGDNKIALRLFNNNSNHFANSAPGQEAGMQNVLQVTSPTIDQSSILRVFEPVLLREVDNVIFNINDARIHNVSTVVMYQDSRENHSRVEQSLTFKVSYTITETKSWKDSVSITRKVADSWISGVPYVGELGWIEVSRESPQSSVQWGAEVAEERVVEYEQALTIPPGTKVTLKVVAIQAHCDVPYTCDVRDTMTDGNVREYTKTDGLYVGSNKYGLVTQILDDDL